MFIRIRLDNKFREKEFSHNYFSIFVKCIPFMIFCTRSYIYYMLPLTNAHGYLNESVLLK